MRSPSIPWTSRPLPRWVASAGLLGVLLLSGCSKEAGDAFFEAFAQIIIIAMIIAFIGFILALVMMAVHLTVIVLNFARPSRVTMVSGYVLGGLHGFSMLGGVAYQLSTLAEANPEAPSMPLGQAAFGFGSSLVFTALLLGSSYYAQRTLTPTPPPAHAAG